MADGVSEERRELFSSLRVELGIITQKWRFLLGARIAIGVFGGTLFSAMFSAYQALIPASGESAGLARHGLIFIPLLGIVSLAAAFFAERRLFRLYTLCVRRGEYIESELGITDGIYKQMRALPRPFGVTTSAIGVYLAFAIAAGIWFFLLVAAF